MLSAVEALSHQIVKEVKLSAVEALKSEMPINKSTNPN